MDESQGRFKVTSKFNPGRWGGGYDITVEDQNTGQVYTDWCYDKVDVDNCVSRITAQAVNAPGNTDAVVSYTDGGDSPDIEVDVENTPGDVVEDAAEGETD